MHKVHLVMQNATDKANLLHHLGSLSPSLPVLPQAGMALPLISLSCPAEQHEQDMLEELDKMHEECQALREDSKVSTHGLLMGVP